MLDTLLVFLIAALVLQIVLTQNFLSRLRAADPDLFARLGRPNASFFLFHGGPDDRHPFLEFLKRRAYAALPAHFSSLSADGRRLHVLYRVVSGLWIATIVSAVVQVVIYISR